MFAEGLEDLECTNVTIYVISTDDTVLIKQGYYKAAYEENKFIRKKII
ncbi:6296_t:CDS:1, partial [Ambispora leptoticha]